ncbi:hypothetical protein [Rhodohalobacter sp. 8-1]|uniref:hypothetical protein n=1 Tax=Rhodohalobacter sp. 8-1 TaxID=3131972 RepID=UPI0030ED52EE
MLTLAMVAPNLQWDERSFYSLATEKKLHGTVLSETLEIEPGEQPLARRISGERIAEAFDATFGERGL